MNRRTRTGRPRGTTLIEALVALAVGAFGAIGAAHLQGQVRQHADLVRQRAEAVRLGAAELERLRAFATVAAAPAASGLPSHAAIADAVATVDAASGFVSSTAYTLRTTARPLALGDAKAVRVAVAWTDGRTGPEAVVLASAIAAHDPALGASLALGSGAGTPPGAFGRAPGVPVEAVDLGDGTSAWKPSPDAVVALRFAHAAGTGSAPPPVAVCEGVAPTTPTAALTAAQLLRCRPTLAATSLVRGTVRFSDASPPAPASADPPLALAVRLVLLGAGHQGAPACWTEAVATGADPHVAWACLVVPRADGRWSARAELVPSGWSIGSGAADRRVCRLASDRDASGAIDDASEHPRDWLDVRGALVHQNFAVVRGGEACPAGRGIADPWHTEPHQP
jgi:Tfp pilus assembly protein PilV